MGTAGRKTVAAGIFLTALLLGSLLLVGAAQAAVSYSMTYVANVAAGTTDNEIGTLTISIDSAIAALVYDDSVILSLPSSLEGYGLRVKQPPGLSLFGGTGTVTFDQVDPVSIKVTVGSLSPGAGEAVQILLPLVIDIPGGVFGDVRLTAQAPGGSVFNNSGDVTVASFGIGIIRVTPDSLSFNNIAVGSRSAAKTITVSNGGYSNITLDSVVIAGDDPADFQLQNGDYGGKTITPGSSISLGAVFSPATAGPKQATLKISSDDPLTPVYQVSLSGNGVAAETPPASGSPVTFSDLQGSWAAGAVSRLAGLGLIHGYPDNTFKPDGTITRAEAAVVLSGVLKLPAGGETDLGQFADRDDVPSWALPAVAGLVRAGIIGGQPQQDGALVLAARQPVTRAEMAVLVSGAVVKQLGPVQAPTPTFADGDRIPDWAKPAIAIAVSKKIIGGYPDGTFGPDRPLTRAEAAVLFDGLLDALQPAS